MRLLRAAGLSLLLTVICVHARAVDKPFSNSKQPYYVAAVDKRNLGADESRNVERVRQAYIDFFGNNLQGFLGLLAPAMSWRMLGPGDSPVFQEYNDETARDYFSALNAAFKYDYMHIDQFVVQDNSVVVFGHEHGIGRASKREFNNNWVQVWTFSEGKVVQFRAYVDTNTLLYVMQRP